MDNFQVTISTGLDSSSHAAIAALTELAMTSKSELIVDAVVDELERFMTKGDGGYYIMQALAFERNNDVVSLLALQDSAGKFAFTTQDIIRNINQVIDPSDAEAFIYGDVSAAWLAAIANQYPDRSWSQVVSQLKEGVLNIIFEGALYEEEQQHDDQSRAQLLHYVESILGNLVEDEEYLHCGVCNLLDVEVFSALFDLYLKSVGIEKALDVFFGCNHSEAVAAYREAAFDHISDKWLKSTLLGMTNGESNAKAAERVANVIRLAPATIQTTCLGFYSKEFREKHLDWLLR